jgi:hypothetical protein
LDRTAQYCAASIAPPEGVQAARRSLLQPSRAIDAEVMVIASVAKVL